MQSKFNFIQLYFDYIYFVLTFAEIKVRSSMLPCYCPSCQTQLKVKSLRCESCGTEVSGSYELPTLALLTVEDQQFILDFVRHSGSLKEMANQLDLSYPTVRNRLNSIIEKIQTYEK